MISYTGERALESRKSYITKGKQNEYEIQLPTRRNPLLSRSMACRVE
jgi:hypothetical protein